MTRTLTLLAVVFGLALAGPVACGKRGQLEPPSDKPSAYPRSYPAN
ncbi:MAG: hypothetical protein RLO51_18620 [Thalassobaculum sp.]